MILDATTDSLEVKLAANVTVRQLQFYASYQHIDHGNATIVPSKNFGSTNGTTAVSIVSAPASGKLNQLKCCSIYNCDTVEHTVTVQINSSSNLRTVFNVNLKSGEQVQYSVSKGWQAFTRIGIAKTFNNTVGGAPTKANTYLNLIANNNLTITSGTDFAFLLGKANRNFNTVTVQIVVNTALGATITWAEAAIYKGYPTIASNVTLTRCGWVDVSAGTNHGVNATGAKTIVIPVLDNNIFVGDDIWFVLGNVTSGTNLVVGSSSIVDNVGAGMVQTATGSLRPSLNSSIAFTLQSSTSIAMCSWHGAQNNY